MDHKTIQLTDFLSSIQATIQLPDNKSGNRMVIDHSVNKLVIVR